jgi:hypothetical protein
VLDAIYWGKAAWSELEATTIQKCFSHCGFLHKPTEEKQQPQHDVDDNDSDDKFDNVPFSVFKLTFKYLDVILRNWSKCEEYQLDILARKTILQKAKL